MSTRTLSEIAVVLLVLASARPALADDDLAPMRERFRVGLEHYEAGEIADAIVVWDEIYRELGIEKGYRLAWNLARAYDTRGGLGDAKRAAVAAFERDYFVDLAKNTKGNVSEMARRAGMERHHVRAYLRKYGIDRPADKP